MSGQPTVDTITADALGLLCAHQRIEEAQRSITYNDATSARRALARACTSLDARFVGWKREPDGDATMRRTLRRCYFDMCDALLLLRHGALLDAGNLLHELSGGVAVMLAKAEERLSASEPIC